MKRSYLGFLTLALILIGCGGSSEPLVKTDSTNNSAFPSWYNSFGFTADSTHFYGYGTAVSNDEEIAKSKSELQARAILEGYLAKELEDVRSELERDGSAYVKQKDFVIKLRNAHNKIENEAELLQNAAINSENLYRGFSKVTISKIRVNELVQNGLGSDLNNTKAFISSPSFRSLIKPSD